MHCSESKNPFAPDLEFHYRRKFNIEKAKKAASYLVGTHDFASFCADCTNVSTTIRTIYELKIENYGELIEGNYYDTKLNIGDSINVKYSIQLNSSTAEPKQVADITMNIV